MHRLQHPAYFSILVLFVFAVPADAYLDPGAGSIIFQAIIAVVLGVVATSKLWWARLKAFITNLHSRQHKNDK